MSKAQRGNDISLVRLSLELGAGVKDCAKKEKKTISEVIRESLRY